MKIIDKFDLADKTINLLVVMARTGLEFKHAEKLCKGVAGFTYQDHTCILNGYISDRPISLEPGASNYFTTSDATEEFINWYNVQIIAYRYLHRRPKDKPLSIDMGKVYILKPLTQGISTYGVNPATKILKAAQYEHSNKPTNGVIYR